MATETLTIALTPNIRKDEVKGTDYVSDENDTQIVTLTDGGNIEGRTFMVAKFGMRSPGNPGEGPGGDDVFNINLSNFDNSFNIIVKSMDPGDTFDVKNYDSVSITGGVYTFTFTGSDGQPHTLVINPISSNASGTATVVCFGAGTGISTPQGIRPIETLSAGDLVTCGDGVDRPIRWIGNRALGPDDLAEHPHLRPIIVRPGAFGLAVPTRDVVLSPQHAVLVQGWRAELLFGEAKVLVPAKSLVDGKTVVARGAGQGVDYYHILLDAHHTVLADGLECETLLPAAMAQGALDAGARAEICFLFPDLVRDLSAFGPAFCRSLTVREGLVLASVAAA